MSVPVIVPAKPLDHALSRLAPVLDPPARRALQQAMLTDVVCAAGDVSGDVVVVTADVTVGDLARAYGARVVAEDDPPLGIDIAVARGLNAVRSDRAVVVMGDLPLATGPDLERVITALDAAQVVLARSLDGTGTNALGLRPPQVIATAFGPGSRARHLEAARAAGARVTELALDGIALDVDTPADLAEFLARGRDCHTTRLADALGLAEILAATTRR